MKTLLASLVGFSAVVMVASAGGDRAAGINGAWKITAESFGDSKAPEKYFADFMPRAVFKDGQYSIYVNGVLEEAGTYKLDGAKMPATIDLAITDGKDKGKEQLGIYKLDGDTLTLAFTEPGRKTRPSRFESAKDVGLQVLQRQK